MNRRWIAAGSGLVVALAGIVATATGQSYLFAGGGLVVGVVVYALLDFVLGGRVASLWLATAVVVFAVVTVAGIVTVGGFGNKAAIDPATGINQTAANSFALILAVAMAFAGASYLAVEYLQTGRLASVAGQFTTRTIVLMPIAIAINIVLGQGVGAALKIPIYLDSIGTILVGALAGPVAGAVTGGLSNLLWSYVIPPPFQNGPAAAFAIVAVVIGILAGLAGRAGLLRPRPNRSTGELLVGGAITVVAIAVLATAAVIGYQAVFNTKVSLDQLFVPGAPAWQVLLAGLGAGLVLLAVIGLFALLLIRRDLTATFVVLCGLVTGVVAALISAPIAASVFGGVTGAGTDFLVAAFRQAGLDVQAATRAQGLISDPIDKVTTFFVVYVILNGMANRFKARFPQGERVVSSGEEAIV